MTSVLLSLTIWTCSVNILNRSTAAGVYNFPSSVLFGGCVLSASKMLLYHFYKRKQEMIHDYHDRVHLQLTDLERSTLVVACIRSTYIFMRGSNAPLSEQTWASDSSTPRPIRFSWYCTTQPVTYSDRSLMLLLRTKVKHFYSWFKNLRNTIWKCAVSTIHLGEHETMIFEIRYLQDIYILNIICPIAEKS